MHNYRTYAHTFAVLQQFEREALAHLSDAVLLTPFIRSSQEDLYPHIKNNYQT